MDIFDADELDEIRIGVVMVEGRRMPYHQGKPVDPSGIRNLDRRGFNDKARSLRVEPVAWITGSTYPLTTVFLLAAYRLYLGGRFAPAALLALAGRVLGNAPEAEDVAQEVFLRVWKQAPRWRPGAAEPEPAGRRA